MEKNLSAIIIDDSQDVQELICELLGGTERFKSIVLADDGLDGLQKISRQKFDLIILDINMPKMDGIQALELLSKGRDAKESKILMVSGAIDSENLKSTVSLGAKHFIVKPFSNENFIKKISSLMSFQANKQDKTA